ncbi:MAG: triose-phosphate isomerase, partial [Candidatus Zixiibacteriota bacterium]
PDRPSQSSFSLMARPKIIAGNWKMNGSPAQTEKLLKALLKRAKPKRGVTVVVCPPFVSLPIAAKIVKNKKILLGAQDVSENKNGAFTGDISAEMLKSIGIKYVIIGHSERRQYHHEDDSVVNSKTLRALKRGLIPIICIGETLPEREAGAIKSIVAQQLSGAIRGLESAQLKRIIIAYEPVWAIGTGKTATPEMAQEVHLFIREQLALVNPTLAKSIPIIYGGSVKPENALGLMSQPDIDGALVGGASLDADSFISILGAA